jgi:hypothetical protein
MPPSQSKLGPFLWYWYDDHQAYLLNFESGWPNSLFRYLLRSAVRMNEMKFHLDHWFFSVSFQTTWLAFRVLNENHAFLVSRFHSSTPFFLSGPTLKALWYRRFLSNLDMHGITKLSSAKHWVPFGLALYFQCNGSRLNFVEIRAFWSC